MCSPSDTADDETEKELKSLLTAFHKDKFLPQLLSHNISSVEILASTSFETLSACLPKMVARSLHSTLSKTYELYLVFKSKNKLEFYGPLVMSSSSSKNIHSLEDFCKASAEDFEKMDVKMPKMTMRVLQKTAQEFIQLRSLRTFLKSIEKEKCLDSLVNAGIKTPQDIRDSDIETLSNATKSKMLARVLLKKATEYCASIEPDVPDGPDYKPNLKTETKNAICSIWRSIKGHSLSFGAKYYEMLVKMDQRLAPCFAGVDFNTVGRELDHLLDQFVAALDAGSQEQFDELSDGLVARMTKYGIPCRSLWFGDKAFSLAIAAIAPELEMTRSLDCWEQFYRAIIPPLHPTLVKAADLPSVEDWDEVEHSLVQKINESFAQRGYLCLTSWLNSNDHKYFNESFGQAIRALSEWKKGKGSWSKFVDVGPQLFSPLSEELSLEFCILTEDVVRDKYGANTGKKIGNVLKILGMALYGPEKLSKCFRNIQRDTVWSQWIDIYTHTSGEFGETFYDFFTRDHVIKGKFQDTNMMMQRVLFTGQMNSVLTRFCGGGHDEKIREMLLELGAKHRVYYNVGLLEMNAMMEPLLSTLKEMLGRTQWREDTADSWMYIMSVITNYMIVGWSCGVSVLSHISLLGGDFDAAVLRELRDSARKEFEEFFSLFAKETSTGGCPQKASLRYMKSVSRLIDEPDPSFVIDQVKALGRRHRKHHGVTVEHLIASAKPWMSCAKSSFGKLFTEKVALEWARLWELFAASTSPEYMKNEKAPSVKDLMAPYRTAKLKKMLSVRPTVHEPVVLTLKEKENHPNNMVLLRFACSPDVEMQAGQFVKLRFKLPDGTSPSRFYSAASCPNPVQGTSSSLQFFIKEVKKGRVSPYLVNEIQPEDSCELVTVAGGFVLPKPVHGMSRLMVSAGVGIVAFISAIRSIVAHVENGLVKEKVSLALIHSERDSSFPFLEELLDIAKRFSNHELLSFDLTLCFTGRETNKKAVEQLGKSSVISGRLGTELLSSIREKFSAPSETPVYACGPRTFQKKVREAFLKEIGHKRTLIHLEFFDL